MILNKDELKRQEESKDIVTLYTIRQENRYLYMKARKVFSDRIEYLELPAKNGNIIKTPYILKSDYEALVSDRNQKKAVYKRGYVGRPYTFCKDCEKMAICNKDTECELRREYLERKEKILSLSGDDRYWKNGTPKKNLILCKYAKYLYAHKIKEFTCQKDKCRFYVNGKCELNIDK